MLITEQVLADRTNYKRPSTLSNLLASMVYIQSAQNQLRLVPQYLHELSVS